MSNALYDAIITLDRSARDAAAGGWICGLLGEGDGPKCVNGLITWHLGDTQDADWRPCYITSDDMTDEQRAAAAVAGRALLKTIPEEVKLELSVSFTNDDIDAMTAGQVENRLIDVNDAETYDHETRRSAPTLNGQLAAAWFNRALDLLAQQLPEPVSVNDFGRIVL